MTPPGFRFGDAHRAGEAQHPDTELGAYLLAALGPDDEAALERHLLHCESCQDRLVELTEVLPALDRLPAAAALDAVDAAAGPADPIAPPASIAVPVGGRARRGVPRGAARWRIAAAAGGVAAAAAAAILVAVAIGSDDPGGPGPAPSASVENVALVKVFPYTGDDQVTVRAWTTANGSDITVQCSNNRVAPTDPAAPRDTYELWAVRTNNTEYKVSAWPAVYGEETFPGQVDFPVDQIRAFELRSNGKVLSTVR